MPQVPTRAAPSQVANSGGLPLLRTPDFGRLPNETGVRLPAIVTPRVQGGRMDPGRADTRIEAGVDPRLAAIPGQQLQQTGRALSEAGGELGRIALDIQMQTNALVTDAAVNRAKEIQMRLVYDKDTGLTALRGFDALNRPDGRPLAAEYVSKFDEATQAIAGELKNEAQRLAFNAQVSQLRLSLENQAVQHEANAFREYNLSVQEGTIKTEIENIGLNYNNPEIVNPALERLKGAVAEQGFALGRSAQWITAQQREMTSKAHSVAIGAAIQNEQIAYAEAYLKRYSEDMTADDVLRAKGIVTKEVDGRVALAASARAMGDVVAHAGATDMGRMEAITAQSESGNRERDAQGRLITSPAGAQGKMQVMPGTNRDPGFGVRPAQDDSDAERTRVGRDYLRAMVKRYNGDAAMAWAAYNAGPGRLDNALAEARKSGRPWLSLMPAETQDYVRKNLAALATGGGQPKPLTLEDALNRVRSDPTVATSPSRLAMAEADVRRRFNDFEASKKAREEDLVAQALRGVEANGGDYMALPPALRAALPADKLDTVMNFADKVAGGRGTSNMALYQQLADDNHLASLTDAQLWAMRPELSASDFKHFADRRAKLLSPSGEGGDAPGNLNTATINATLKDRLETMGLDPKKDAARYGAVTRFVNEKIIEAQAEYGKKFDDAQTIKFVDGLFLKSRDFTNTLWGGTQTKQLLGMSIRDVPDTSRQAIEKALKARGQPVTEDAILGAYWHAVTRSD